MTLGEQSIGGANLRINAAPIEAERGVVIRLGV